MDSQMKITPTNIDSNEYQAFLQFLQKYNLKDTEEIFKKELNKDKQQTNDNHDVDASFYYETYETLYKFVDNVPKDFKHELAQVLYPVFLHLYLELVNKGLNKLASEFYDRFASYQVSYHSIDLKQLRLIANREQLAKSEFRDTIGSGKYNIKLCEESYRLLKDFVRTRNFKKLVDIIKENMLLEIYNGEPRDMKQQLVNVGGILGETNSNTNVEKMYYGLFKEADLNLQIEDNDEQMEGISEDFEKPKGKKKKKDALMNKKRGQDPNAPPFNRIPLPEFREIDRLSRLQAMKDFNKRARLGPDKLPSICFYTLLNTHNRINCCDVTDDSEWLALGLNDSSIRLYSLVNNKKLKQMKHFSDLELLDKEVDDVFALMFDDETESEYKNLVGHAGPIFGISFSPDKYYLVSASEDGTVRLWCLLTFSCLVCYKGHNGPVWDVKFGPYNHYFASCGADKTARLWAIDQYQSLRIYIEHLSDVDCLCFHPNSNYIATGCTDRGIRILDLASLAENPIVRHLTGHKNAINILKFSYCGRYLASGGHDGVICLWDVATPVIIAQFTSHRDSIFSLDFSRDNVVLASGGLDNDIKIWYIAKLTKDIEQSEDPSSFATKCDTTPYEIGSFKTKLSPITYLHFTRRNLLLGVGPFISE